MSTLLVSILKRHAVESPDAPFVVHLASGTTLTYARLLETSEKMAAVLAALGVGKKDKVAFVVRNHWLVYPLLIACASRRATLVPVDPELHRDELAFILDDAAPALTIHVDGASPANGGHGNSGNGKRVVRGLEEILALIESTDRDTSLADDFTPEVASDVALMIYTSGTTGTNKCVMLTSGNLVTNAVALARRYSISADDSFYCTLPTHHMNALMMTGMVPFVAGARVYLSDILSFKNAKRYWTNVAELGVTVASFVPSILALHLKLTPQGTRSAGWVPNKIRFGFCGAAPLPASTWRAFEEAFGFPIHQGYGLTETTCWATSSPPEGPSRWDSVGIPLDCCDVKIDASRVPDVESLLFESDAAEAPRVVSGEVLIAGPIVASGYFKNPKLTRESTTADGYFRTGDLGYFDAEGHLHISGRIKDVIIKNGANVLSADVDRVLLAHPAIEHSKTIGVKDDLVGERIVSACVVRGGHAVTDQELRSWANERLSPHLRPDAVVFVGYLPAGAAGKISTNVLRKIVSGALADEIVNALNSWKYKRAQPSDAEAIRATIQRSLLAGAPIELLTYWGCGTRAKISALDRAALDRLRDYLEGARRVPQAPPKLTIVFTDSHTRNNRIPQSRSDEYFAAVAEHAHALGMVTVRMSELWTRAEIDAAKIDAHVRSDAFEAAWRAHPLRERLIDQARKHVEQGADPEAAARSYLATCAFEGRGLAALFPHSVFATYNHPDFDVVSPALPKVYLSSYKEGTSAKPWFID